MNVSNYNQHILNYSAKPSVDTQKSKAAPHLQKGGSENLIERAKKTFAGNVNNLQNEATRQHHHVSRPSIDAGTFKKVKSCALEKFANLEKINESTSQPELATGQTKSSQVMAWDNGELQRIQIVKSETARVPPGTADKLSDWLDKNSEALTAKTTRIYYTKEQIPQALAAFEKECGCSWQQMKHKWGNNRTYMQIINDVRTVQIEEISAKLKADPELSGLPVFESAKEKLTSDNLSKWLDKNGEILASQTARVPYSREQIGPALEAFEKECGTDLQQMNDKWGNNPAYLQIINDVRSMQVEEISAKLKADPQLSGLQVFDFGSDKLTSDRDLSLSITGSKETEVMAVKKYNQLFAEAGWGATPSHVFDNNAYTQFYIEDLNKVDHQKEQHEQQNIMSHVMFVRNAGKERWLNLKEEILKNANPASIEMLKKQFLRVESLVNRLEQEHNQELFKKVVKKDPHSKLSSEVANQTYTAQALERAQPQMIVNVDNSLHNKYKEKVSNTISWRNQLNKLIDSLGKKDADPVEIYTKSTMIIGHFLKQREADLSSEKAILQSEASKSDPKKGTDLREQSLLINKEKENLETIQVWSACREIKLLAEERSLLKKSINGGNAQEKILKLEIIEDRLKILLAKLPQKEPMPSTMVEQIKKAEKELENCNTGDIAKLDKLVEMSDKMQLFIEANQMKAQCFAQEAHVTAGAFGFVVQDIQGKRNIIRSLGAYMQATNELMGFYHAHQGHAHTPHGKMIEVSKYVGPRLMEGYKRMREQATAKGLSFPIFEKTDNIQGFFTELLAIRGGSIHPETLRMGLEQVKDGEIQNCRSELLQCKSEEEAQMILKKNGISPDKMNLINKYFTSKEGGVVESQQEALVSEIAQRHQMPIKQGKKKNEIDTNAIDTMMNGMHAQTAAWLAGLTL